MSQRVSRKEMKRDEFTATVGRSFTYLTSHWAMILGIAGGVVLLALGVVGVFQWLQARNASANEALARAMRVYSAPLVEEEASPDDPDEPSFASEEARREKAQELFESLQDEYGGTRAGGVAGLYLGRIAAAGGDLEAARAHWEGFVEDNPDHLLASEARLNLLQLALAQGRAEEVVTELEGMMVQPDAPLPDDVILFHLARAYETAERPEEAEQTYRRIVEEFPESGYSTEARQRTESGGLPAGAMPQLRRAMGASTGS